MAYRQVVKKPYFRVGAFTWQERDLEIELLQKQLEEFKVGAALGPGQLALASGQLALATAAVGAAGAGPGIAVADGPPAGNGGGGWGAALPAQRPGSSLR